MPLPPKPMRPKPSLADYHPVGQLFELQRGPLFLHEISKTPHRSLPRFQSNYGKTLRRTHCWALPPRPNTTITTPTVTPTATPLAPSCTNSLTGEPTPKPSYAQKAQNTPDTPNPTPKNLNRPHWHETTSPSNRQPFVSLKESPWPASSLLKEVQEVKTGFALCTNSPTNLAALKTKEAIIATAIGSCKIETQEKWATYRLNYVPRNVTVFNDSFEMGSIPVTKEIIYEAIKEYSGQELTHAVQTQTSMAADLRKRSNATVATNGTTPDPVPDPKPVDYAAQPNIPKTIILPNAARHTPALPNVYTAVDHIQQMTPNAPFAPSLIR
ncbi:hypothetical protein DID88_009540 [Monilinia fructigena]|uniref:Uncharacterized protein n=1 Tax=Monilinia fructigena TaxID=38457 RepID=A0A395ICF5_9HELO|nr:hypothetical protein DID88_009540 [Monilinia fructigena]